MGQILDELNQIISEKDKIVNSVAMDLYNELINATPVDTGYLRGGWEIDFNENEVIINNSVEYAEIRLLPAIIGDNGKLIQGSLQNPAGIEEILDKYDRILTGRLKGIK